MKKKLKKQRILFAAVDIGWRINLYKSFLESKFGSRVHIKSFVKHKVSNKQYRTNYNYHFQYIRYPKIVQWLISFTFFSYALLSFNTFYFFSGETILTRKLRRFEFIVYRFLGKRVIMHFVGSDIRDYHYLYWKNENLKTWLLNRKSPVISTNWQRELIIDCQHYANQVLVSTPDLLSIATSAKYFPVVIDVNSFQKELQLSNKNKQSFHFKSNRVKILHAPSNPNTKGSTLIDQVLQELLGESNSFEYINTQHLHRDTKSLYTVSRYELFQLYNEADIVIDQMVIGWYGMQAIEAILAKNLVICYVEEELKKYLYPNCPIITADIFELKNKLLLAIDRIKNHEVDFEAQINWVKKFHHIESNHHIILEALNLNALNDTKL